MKKVLVVANHIPVFDTNAGDYRIFQIIRILSKKHRLFFLPLMEPGRKYKFYINQLKKAGAELLGPADVRKIINYNFDLVIFEFYHSALKLIDWFRAKPSVRVIVDSHIIKYIENQRLGWLSEKKLIESRGTELSIYRKADTVIAVSEREKDILEDETSAEVICIPTAIKISDEIRGRKGRKNIVFIGYMNNRQNQDAVLWFANKIFPLILKEIPSVRFYVVGSSPPEKIKKLSSDKIRVVGYVPDPTLYTSSCLVSVVPLRVGGGIKQKILDAMAYGSPVVSTSTSAEGMGLTDGEDVFLADDPDYFAERVIRLYRKEKIWYKLSLNGYKKVKGSYSMDSMEQKFLKQI